MGSQYSHLCDDQRSAIEHLLAQGLSQRRVAGLLGLSPSTVCRERRRGLFPPFNRYLAELGSRHRLASRAAAGHARRKLSSTLLGQHWRAVLPLLRQGWSPEQVAGRLKLMPDSPQVSHETIYCAIYAMPRGALRTELVKLLRKSHSGRRSRARGNARFTGLLDMTPIALRPPEIAARIVPGHWEGDLIKGARNASAVGTLVERISRYVMLAGLDGLGSSSILDSFTRRLRTIPPSLRKTLTYDQGTEMADHKILAKRLRMDIFFCDPHSPWQRGSNENANGLIREYLPKGMDLSCVTDEQLRHIETSLNTRPRKVLGFLTPLEVFSSLKLDNIAGVALQA